MNNKTLAEKMRDLATSGHDRAAELLDKADELEKAVCAQDMRKLLGAWARARRLWH